MMHPFSHDCGLAVGIRDDVLGVISRKTNRIVWQYGHDGVPGRAPGYLDNPDGVDLAPPDSLLMAHAATTGRP